MNHYVMMGLIMILSGILSTMNVWADKVTDVRFTLNDVYMILLMTGWMLLFMGLLNRNTTVIVFGAFLVALNIWCIRTQFAISARQYIQGMIPHHSMAVHMSRKLLETSTTTPEIQRFVQSIIQNQEDEIMYMKRL